MSMFTSKIDEKRFKTLIEINELINSQYSDTNVLLNRILESATLLTGGEASSLLLVHPSNNKLYFEIALGSKGKDVKQFSLNMGEGIAGWVAKHNTSLIVNDVTSDPRFFSDISKQIGFATHSILASPMRIKNTCVGVIEIINKKNGSSFNNEDLEWLEIFCNQAALAIQNAKQFQKANDEIYLLQDQLQKEKGYHTFLGKSQSIIKTLEVAKKVASSNSSVLLLGESGVGKELFAEQIHLHSERVSKPFIRVNCAALPEHLLESELFGHIKGAFTDAISDRKGRFELANQGTIFLDEIAEIPVNLQAKLLRVIQEGIFEKIGSSEPFKVDVRIIAATNKNLDEAIEEKTFRKDLYYRLNVLPLEIPPLRERREDIPLLAEHFLKRSNMETKKQITGFTSETMELLLSYHWPGNVRELENSIERAVVLCAEDIISPKDISLDTHSSDGIDTYYGRTLKEAVNLFKRHFILSSLNENEGNQTETAKKLGIQRTYLSRLIRELDIER